MDFLKFSELPVTETSDDVTQTATEKETEPANIETTTTTTSKKPKKPKKEKVQEDPIFRLIRQDKLEEIQQLLDSADYQILPIEDDDELVTALFLACKRKNSALVKYPPLISLFLFLFSFFFFFNNATDISLPTTKQNTK